MAESIERYFRLMPVSRKHRPTAERAWCPAADVYQTAEGWIVKVELAGVQADELEISIQAATLRIGGRRRDAHYSETISYHQLEITYSRFEKTLHFPCSIEGVAVETHYRDGLLILHLRSNSSNQAGCQ